MQVIAITCSISFVKYNFSLIILHASRNVEWFPSGLNEAEIVKLISKVTAAISISLLIQIKV